MSSECCLMGLSIVEEQTGTGLNGLGTLRGSSRKQDRKQLLPHFRPSQLAQDSSDWCLSSYGHHYIMPLLVFSRTRKWIHSMCSWTTVDHCDLHSSSINNREVKGFNTDIDLGPANAAAQPWVGDWIRFAMVQDLESWLSLVDGVKMGADSVSSPYTPAFDWRHGWQVGWSILVPCCHHMQQDATWIREIVPGGKRFAGHFHSSHWQQPVYKTSDRSH